MFKGRQMTCYKQRKADLLHQIACQRRLLAREALTLQKAISWVDLGIDLGLKARTACSVLEPLLFFWQGPKMPKTDFARKLAGAVALARPLLALWRSRR